MTTNQYTIYTEPPSGYTDPWSGWHETETVAVGDRITLSATGSFYPWLTGQQDPMPATGPDGYSATWFPDTSLTMLPGAPFCALIGFIGNSEPTTGDELFLVGAEATLYVEQAGKLWLAANEVPFAYADNVAVGGGRAHFDVDITVENTGGLGVPPSTAPPPFSFGGCAATQKSGNPINLLNGEKTLSETDLSIQTPAGPLAFTRHYRSGSESEVLGVGWTHNHDFRLSLAGTSPDSADIQVSNGGILHLDEDSGQAGHFEAGDDSVAVLDADSSEYVLTTQDASEYRFESASAWGTGVYRLKSITYPTGEVRNYHYASTGDEQLDYIDDDYVDDSTPAEAVRTLQFRYIGGSDFDAGKLWRVGDHSADLDANPPTGRYVEFAYVEEHDDGSPVSPDPKALLEDVTDVHAQTWTYTYYGKSSGEDETDLLNLLTQIDSPLVDTTGNGTADSSITLQKLAYSYQRDIAVNGDMELDADWSDVGAPTTNSQSATRVDSDTYSRLLEGDSNDGIQGEAFNLVKDRSYSITARVYVETGSLKMQVSSDSSFDATSSTSGAWETLSATNVVPTATTTDHRLQFMAQATGTKVYIDSVEIVEDQDELAEIVQERGIIGSVDPLLTTLFGFQPGGNNQTTETVEGQTTIHHFDEAVYQGTANPAGDMPYQVLGYNYRPFERVDANSNRTKLLWSGDGRHLQKVTDPFQQVTSFSYDNEDRLSASLDAEGRKTKYTYDSSERQPTDIEVYDDDDETELLQWQQLVYDSMGRVLEEKTLDPSDGTGQTIFSKVERTYYDDNTNGGDFWLNGLLRQVIQHDLDNASNNQTTTYFYDEVGRVKQTNQSQTFGSCTKSYTIYDAAGNVVASICNFDLSHDPTNPLEDADDAVTLRENTTDPAANLVTTHQYDTLGRRIQTTSQAGTDEARTSLTVYDGLGRVVRTVSNYDDSIAPSSPYTAAHSAFSNHGTDGSQNRVSDTLYNDLGQVEQQIDPLGNVSYQVYDTAGRPIRVVQRYVDNSTDDPSVWTWNASLGVWKNSQGGDISHGADKDQNIIRETQYDAAGNVVKTLDVVGDTRFTVYDALNRVVKTVNHANADATIDLDPGDTGYDEDNDPRTEDYVPSTNPDRDHLTRNEYDRMGRLVKTWDVAGNCTLYGFDDLGRQVRVIRNAHDPDYNLVLDPDLSAYAIAPGVNGDQDLVSTTTYADDGRVLYTQGVDPAKTWQAYDGLGRQVKTIINAQGTATDDGDDDPRSSTYTPSTEPDEDHISSTHYDSDGRVQWTQDPLGRKTATVYDAVGRRIATIQNYVDNTVDLDEWVWNNGWEDGGGDPITLDSDPDKDRVSRTEYDEFGRVAKQVDVRGNVTYPVYDSAGRQFKTVRNAKADATIDLDPGDTGYDATDDPRSTSYVASTAADEDLISETVYDSDGRVLENIDPAGHTTRFEYDALGRRVKTITNYVDGTSTEPDEDLIAETVYNIAGQVVESIDHRGTKTTFTYDAAGRRLTVTQAAATSLATTTYTCYDQAGRVYRSVRNWITAAGDPSTWVWDEVDGRWEDGSGGPIHHGHDHDRNLVSDLTLDELGRVIQTMDMLGNTTSTQYGPDGRVQSRTDALGHVTRHVYDELGRLVRVVQNYQPQTLEAQLAYFTASGPPAPYYTLYLKTLDSSPATDIVEDGILPAWSPDGAKIAYLQSGEELHIINIDGTGDTTITDPVTSNPVVLDADDDSVLVWTADGETFVYLGGGAVNAYTIGKSPVQILNTIPYGVNTEQIPAVSPDGRRILFIGQDDNDNLQVYGVDIDGTNFTNLTNSDESSVEWGVSGPPEGSDDWTAFDPAWSPDGTQIVFSANYGENEIGIYVMDANGDNQTLLAASDDYNATPQWSPDGSQIAFLRFTSSGGTDYKDIYVMDADGSNLSSIVHHQVNDTQLRTFLSWSPDSQQLAFLTDKDGNLEVYVVDADGSNETRLTNNSSDEEWLGWFPVTQSDPAWWVWSSTNSRWQDHLGNPIDHGTNNDQNIIVDVELDKGGRRRSLRDPRGNETDYVYDDLNRRTKLTNLLTHEWVTAYADLSGGGSRISLTDPLSHVTQQDFDKAGRLATIDYLSENPKLTPDVIFSYNKAGNRTLMAETVDGGTNYVRKTGYQYDDARRLTQVDFDSDGDDTVDQSVSYEYDEGGLRTKLVLPDNKAVVYTYDERGQLTGMSLDNWETHATTYRYDEAGRLRMINRDDAYLTLYAVNAAGQLEQIEHRADGVTLGRFAYAFDANGNRTQKLDIIRRPDSTPLTLAHDDDAVSYTGTWSTVSGFAQTVDFDAALTLPFYGEDISFTLGVGPDHSLCDVYVDNVFWGSLDNYAASASERTVDIPLSRLGLHTLKLRNRAERNLAATGTGFKLRFKQAQTYYDGHLIAYAYDALARLTDADYFAAWDAVNPVREYDFVYDLAGNRTQEVVEVNGTPTTTNYTYDAANRMTAVGAQSITYNNAGQMTDDGTLTYSWDRGGRLLSAGGSSYAYNGLGNRLSQTVSAVVTDYLLDLQPGLSKVLASTTSGNTTRYVHHSRGLHSQQQSNGDWVFPITDGLNSVRSVVGESFDVLHSQYYAPYGEPFGESGTSQTEFGFTGEPTDGNDLVHLRARYHNPILGVFPNLDPVEGALPQAMSLNRYGYVAGNVVNLVDPSGEIYIPPQPPDGCNQSGSSNSWNCNNQAILDATVVIEAGRYRPGIWSTCSENSDIACDGVFNSLGVMVSDGIITHSHYFGDNSWGLDLAGQRRSFNDDPYRNLFDWIRFIGPLGSVRVPTEELFVNGISQLNPAVLFISQETFGSGEYAFRNWNTHVQASHTGLRHGTYNNPSAFLMSQSITIPYILSVHSALGFARSYIGGFRTRLTTGQPTMWPFFDIVPAYVFEFDNSASPLEHGDSGAGVFACEYFSRVPILVGIFQGTTGPGTGMFAGL